MSPIDAEVEPRMHQKIRPENYTRSRIRLAENSTPHRKPNMESLNLALVLVQNPDCERDLGLGRAVPADRFLEAFLYHVDGGKIPKAVKRPVENDASERAWAGLMGLERGFVSELAAHPEFRTRLVSAWPGIFRWCRYFYDQRVAAEPDPDNSQVRITTICTLIRDFYLNAELRATVRATPGIITLCTRLWIHPAAPLSACIPFRSCTRVVAAAGGRPEAVAKTFLDRLRKTISKAPMHAEHASTLTFTLTTFIGLPRHPLAFAVLADNGAWVVARTLFLASQATANDDYLACIRTALTFLRRALVQYDSPRLVAQALDAGLLPAICDLSSVLEGTTEQAAHDSLRFILRDILPKNMVYRSVIKVMKRENRDIDGEAVDRGVMRSVLREEWMSLGLLTYLRSAVAKLPKEVRGRGSVVCERMTIQCTKCGHKSELLRCGGCLHVYYCSKTCQKAAWPAHRDMCKLKKQSHDTGGRPFFPEQDAQFLRELFVADAQIHHAHLQEVAKREFPAEPGENLIICIDYTDARYPAGTCSLKNIRTYVFPPVSSDAADPANVRAQNDEMIKMVRRAPREYAFIEATFAYGERRLTRNVMLRPNMWATPASEAVQSSLDWQNSRSLIWTVGLSW
ncbi:hypothetical protein FB451DRAFT_1350598 [Mycena latifolia]|nr:hypothetical protein FB451DRAFT_1350598 [Mycena latifolia]